MRQACLLLRKPSIHIDLDIDSATGRSEGLLIAVFESSPHHQGLWLVKNTNHVQSIGIALTGQEFLSSFVSEYCSNIQSLFSADYSIGFFQLLEGILENEISDHGIITFIHLSIRSSIVYLGIIGVISPKNSLLHRIAAAVSISFVVSKNSPVLPAISVLEYSSIGPHCLHSDCLAVCCTSEHESHAQSIVGLLPYRQSLFQVSSIHHHISHSQSPLEANLALMNITETCLVDSNSGCRHSGQGSNNSRISQSQMGYFTSNMIDCDEFVLIDTRIRFPVQISHSVQIVVSSLSPHSKERTKDGLLFEEFGYQGLHVMDFVFYHGLDLWVFYSEESQEFIYDDSLHVILESSRKG